MISVSQIADSSVICVIKHTDAPTHNKYKKNTTIEMSCFCRIKMTAKIYLHQYQWELGGYKG
jgi:hypothetical protein